MHGAHVRGETVIRLNTGSLKREGQWLHLSLVWYPVSNTLTDQEAGRGRDSAHQLSLAREYESRLLAGVYLVRTDSISAISNYGLRFLLLVSAGRLT